MNFGEALVQVYDITKRPDKVDETKRAINSAIRHYSLAATFSNDLVEGTVAINATQYAQSFSIATNFPQFRKLWYLTPVAGKFFLEYLDPARAVTPKGCTRTNVWYRAGDNIVINLQNLYSQLDYGYLKYYNDLIADADTHWMLTVIPHVVIDKAISRIFASVGEEKESVRYKGFADEAFVIARNDLSTGVNW